MHNETFPYKADVISRHTYESKKTQNWAADFFNFSNNINSPFEFVVPGDFFLFEGVGVLSLEFPAEWTVDNEELRPSTKTWIVWT